ncbi:MAG: hypothetical protein ACKO39_09375, partial [Chthoniobacterales bacterium]
MKKTGCALLLLFLALCASVFFNLVFVALLGAGEAQSMTTSGWRAQMEEITLEDGVHGAGKIAVIPVQGVIHTAEQTEWGTSMVDDIKKALRAAAEDD